MQKLFANHLQHMVRQKDRLQLVEYYKKVSIEKGKSFQYLDMEMFWSKCGSLNFIVS
jgi:hypothetical protein